MQSLFVFLEAEWQPVNVAWHVYTMILFRELQSALMLALLPHPQHWCCCEHAAYYMLQQVFIWGETHVEYGLLVEQVTYTWPALTNVVRECGFKSSSGEAVSISTK